MSVRIILSPKDTTQKMVVECRAAFQEGRALTLVLGDGSARSYPMEHLWYWAILPPTETESRDE